MSQEGYRCRDPSYIASPHSSAVDRVRQHGVGGMTVNFPLWAILPVGLTLAGLWLLSRPSRGLADLLEAPIGLGCLVGAALFMIGRCAA
jgi:hypothetical protein